MGYALLTEAGQQLLACALASIDPIAQVAKQNVPADQIDAFSALLGQLAGIHLANA